MNIIFVRHGHPDYKNDCLTELGHIQAEAAAERLKDEKLDKIFSSSCGRAYETALHIAKRHNTEVTKLDFMREIKWVSHPWRLAREWVANGKDIMKRDWANDETLKDDVILECYKKVSEGFDEWLKGFGLVREGNYYRIEKTNDETIMLVSHGGSSTVVLSHLFNMPFTFVCRAIEPDFTAVTAVSFKGDEGSLIAPTFLLVNDARHIEGITVENVIDR